MARAALTELAISALGLALVPISTMGLTPPFPRWPPRPHFHDGPHACSHAYPGELLSGRESTLRALCAFESARNVRRHERFARDAERPPARVFAVSDVHYDHPGAREWASALSRSAYQDDVLIVAGDVGDTYQAVRLCLRAFRAVFRRVFYVPGNHDLWIRPKGMHSDEPRMFADSIAKLLALWQMCAFLTCPRPAALCTRLDVCACLGACA